VRALCVLHLCLSVTDQSSNFEAESAQNQRSDMHLLQLTGVRGSTTQEEDSQQAVAAVVPIINVSKHQ